MSPPCAALDSRGKANSDMIISVPHCAGNRVQHVKRMMKMVHKWPSS